MGSSDDRATLRRAPGDVTGRRYAELQVTSHFSFLRGASSCEELFAAAAVLGIAALAVVDRNSLAGAVRAHEAAKATGVHLVVGCRLDRRNLRGSGGRRARHTLLRVSLEVVGEPRLKFVVIHARHPSATLAAHTSRRGRRGAGRVIAEQEGPRVAAALDDPPRSPSGADIHTPALTHLHLVAFAAQDYVGALSSSEVGLVYDIETIARRLKAGVTRMWATLTTSEAANASEAHYRATSDKMAADLIDRERRKAREEKPGVRPPADEGSLFGD
jgi:hypothetical protein